jgi:hypothetical protein
MKRALDDLQGATYRENPVAGFRHINQHSPYTSKSLEGRMLSGGLVGDMMSTGKFVSDVTRQINTVNYTLLDHTNVEKPEHLFGRPLFLAVGADTDKRAAYTLDALNHFLLRKWSETDEDARKDPLVLKKMFRSMRIAFLGFFYDWTPRDRGTRAFSVLRHSMAEARMVLPKDPNTSGERCLSFVMGMGKANALQEQLLKRGPQFGIFSKMTGECPIIYPVVESELVRHRTEGGVACVCIPVGEIDTTRTAYIRDLPKEATAGAGVTDSNIASMEVFVHLSPMPFI